MTNRTSVTVRVGIRVRAWIKIHITRNYYQFFCCSLQYLINMDLVSLNQKTRESKSISFFPNKIATHMHNQQIL